MRQSITLLFFSLLLSGPISAYALNCGGLNQRPCTVKERIPSCNRGLVENVKTHRCLRRPKKIIAINLSPQRKTLTRLSQQSRLPVKFRSTVKRIIRNVDHANKLIQKISKLSGNPRNNRDELRNAVRQLQAIHKKLDVLESIADSEIDEAKNTYEEAKEQFKLAMRILSEHMERMTQVTQKITS